MDYKDTILPDIGDTEVECTFIQRITSGLIDSLIFMIIFVPIYISIPKDAISILISRNSTLNYFLIFLLMMLIRLIQLLIFNRTTGMMLCKIKYLNKDLKPLSTNEKIMAVFISQTSKIRYYKMT